MGEEETAGQGRVAVCVCVCGQTTMAAVLLVLESGRGESHRAWSEGVGRPRLRLRLRLRVGSGRLGEFGHPVRDELRGPGTGEAETHPLGPAVGLSQGRSTLRASIGFASESWGVQGLVVYVMQQLETAGRDVLAALRPTDWPWGGHI